jgi:hypothetical protein
MFIRVKNLSTEKELNLNSRNVVSFEPAGDGTNSSIRMSDGNTYQVDKSNRALRHAISKAQGSAPADTDQA